MFDIGFQELMLIFVVGLLVLGPERLPVAIRTVSRMMGRLRASYNSIRAEIEQEIGVEDIKRDLHNKEVMKNLQDAEHELQSTVSGARHQMDDLNRQLQTTNLPDNPPPQPADESQAAPNKVAP